MLGTVGKRAPQLPIGYKRFYNWDIGVLAEKEVILEVSETLMEL